MADVAITAANVVAGLGAKVRDGVAGEAVTAGQALYRAPSGLYMKADADSGTPAARVPVGLALNQAAANQPVSVLGAGNVSLGAVLTPGSPYYLSDTPGGLCPYDDLAIGASIIFMGLASSSSVLGLSIQSTGVLVSMLAPLGFDFSVAANSGQFALL